MWNPSIVKKTHKLICFLFFPAFFISHKLICTNISAKDCKVWDEEFFYYTNCFCAFQLMQNMRFVNIALLWDFRLITYFMYQKWARQSLLEVNLRHSRVFILYLHSGQNSCFSQSKKKLPFFHIFIFLHKQIKKNPRFWGLSPRSV